MIALFWISFLLLFQSYFGTLISLQIVSLFYRKQERDFSNPDFGALSLTVMIPVYNEEEVIDRKIRNLLEQDYPDGEFEILVVSDNSNDKTCEIVRSFSDPRVKLIEMTERYGKLGIIDEIVPRVSGDIIVISDANVMLEADALQRLMKYYRDPNVGAVCGDLPLTAPGTEGYMLREETYRSWEILLKRLMSRFGAVIGGYGGFYSQRRSLFKPLGKTPVHDDVVMPLDVLAQSYNVIYAEDAKASEETQPTIYAEYLRRVRMTALNLNTIPRLLNLSLKSNLKVLYLAIGYKLLRWLSPYLLILLAVSSFSLTGSTPFYTVFSSILTFGLLLVLLGYIMSRYNKKVPLATDLYHFAIMNFAGFAGLLSWLKGVNKYWQPRSK
jgi:cellulose synthase/poly-beta-1,6-N-acetylglucosamine synthase-like glycosyltransferase